MDNAPIVASFPTTIPEITAIVQELQSGILTILGEQLVGLYLEGSLAAGGFDAASDIDFIAVMEEDITLPICSPASKSCMIASRRWTTPGRSG